MYADSLRVVRAGYPYEMALLDQITDRVSSAFNGRIRRTSRHKEILDFQVPENGAFYSWMLAQISRSIEQDVPGNDIILCLMHYPVKGPDGSLIEGYCATNRGISRTYPPARTSFVFTYPDHMSPELPDETFVSRASKVGIHEIGHYFGLEHHTKPLWTRNGLLCLMSEILPDIPFEDVGKEIDKEDSNFCQTCTDRLSYSTEVSLTWH